MWFSTFETTGPGRDILKGNKRTLHTAMWSLHLSSNCSKHRRTAEETDGPNPLPSSCMHLSAAITSIPILPWLPFSAVKTNLTAIAEPASSLAKFPQGITQLTFPQSMTPYSGLTSGKCHYSQVLKKNKQRIKEESRGRDTLASRSE